MAETESERDSGMPPPAPVRERRDYFTLGAIVLSAIIISSTWVFVTRMNARRDQAETTPLQDSDQISDVLGEEVTPSAGITLPVRWGDLGQRMTAAGVIHRELFMALYAGRGGLGADVASFLDSPNNGELRITPQNAGGILNLLWAFGLGNKNAVLEQGPMQDPQYGGAGEFASTGGWTIAAGNPMAHYSAHPFVNLSSDQQALVEKVAKGVYRPCCGNATYFPDCNHGMAMLGLLELMASQGASEDQMYRAALAVNSYWFPDTYRTIARYLSSQGTAWSAADPRLVLGATYSSAQGYARIQTLIAPEPPTQGPGGCGVDAGQSSQSSQPQQGGCGV